MTLSLFATWFEQTNGTALTPKRLTPTDVKEYKAYLLRKGYAASTINTHLNHIRKYAQAALTKKQITTDPTLGIKPVAHKALAPRSLDRREQLALIRESEAQLNASAWQAQAKRNHAMIVFLLNTGLRISELLKLKASDVEVNERSGQMRIIGKGTKQRVVPLNNEARQAWRVLSEYDWHITPRAFQQQLSELARRANLDDVTPHTLRHTFAKNLMDAGVSIEKVSSLLGHSNLNTTRIYILPTAHDLAKAVEAL